MKAYNLICCSIVAGIVATTALAKSSNKTTTPIQAAAALAQPSDLENILKIVTQMQSDLKTLQTAVANLAESQKDDGKQVSGLVKDMASLVRNVRAHATTDEYGCARRLERKRPLHISGANGGR
jgi:hypothetical protein